MNGVVGKCGDGTKQLLESCDDGNGIGGDGCSASCTVEAPCWSCSGTPSVCVPVDGNACASDGNVCTADVCSGGACTHPAANAGSVCRAPAAACDAPEVCDGTSPACPPDLL